jgi:hypothetical protein
MENSTFIGFLAKNIVPKPDWLKADSVREICSLSNCISKTHPDAFEQWQHNRFDLYRTEALAMAVIPEAERASYEIFAYRLWPVMFDENGQRDFEPLGLPGDDETGVSSPPWADEPDWSAWKFLGYDLVGMGMSGFECSPLSCNGYAAECEVNEYCLIDDLTGAMALGKIFGGPEGRVEPADYFLVEVWRSMKGSGIANDDVLESDQQIVQSGLQ